MSPWPKVSFAERNSGGKAKGYIREEEEEVEEEKESKSKKRYFKEEK